LLLKSLFGLAEIVLVYQSRSQALSPLPPSVIGRETLQVAACHITTQNMGAKNVVGLEGWQSILIVAV